MSKKKINLLAIVLFISTSLSAQKTFVSGYFIDNNGSQTDCQIQNLDWINNPSSFKYKLSKTGDLQKRTIEDTKEFGFNGIRYVRFTFDETSMANTSKDLSSDPEPIFRETTDFLRVLVDGHKQLLVDKEDDSEVFYIRNRSDSSNPNPLIYTRYYSSNSMVTTNNGYKQQLKSFLYCKNLNSDKFENLSYLEEDITSLFSDFYKCDGGVGTFENETEVSRKTFFGYAAVGASLQSLSTPYTDKTLDFPNEITPFISAGIGYYLPFHRNKLAIIGRVTTNNYKSRQETIFTIPTTSITRDDVVTFEYQSIDVSIGLRYYSYINKDWSLFGEAFIINPLGVKGEVESSMGPNEDDFSRSIFFQYGIGIEYKRFDLSFQPFNTIEYDNGIDGTSSQIILGYKF